MSEPWKKLKEPKADVLTRLREEFDRTAVCHCGNGLAGGCCDGHSPSWNPDEHTTMVSDAVHEIERLRMVIESRKDIADLVIAAGKVPDLIAWGALIKLAKEWQAVKCT